MDSSSCTMVCLIICTQIRCGSLQDSSAIQSTVATTVATSWDTESINSSDIESTVAEMTTVSSMSSAQTKKCDTQTDTFQFTSIEFLAGAGAGAGALSLVLIIVLIIIVIIMKHRKRTSVESEMPKITLHDDGPDLDRQSTPQIGTTVVQLYAQVNKSRKKGNTLETAKSDNCPDATYSAVVHDGTTPKTHPALSDSQKESETPANEEGENENKTQSKEVRESGSDTYDQPIDACLYENQKSNGQPMTKKVTKQTRQSNVKSMSDIAMTNCNTASDTSYTNENYCNVNNVRKRSATSLIEYYNTKQYPGQSQPGVQSRDTAHDTPRDVSNETTDETTMQENDIYEREENGKMRKSNAEEVIMEENTVYERNESA